MDFLSSFWRKKQIQIDPDELRNMLKALEFSNLGEPDVAGLVAFKESMENKLKQHEIEQLPAWARDLADSAEQPPGQVVVARDLTEENIIAYFDLGNTKNSEGRVVYPEFAAPESGEGCSEWLAKSLNLGVDIFRCKRADITIILDLIVMDVIQHLPRFQVLDHFHPGNVPPERPPAVITYKAGDPPPPPKRMKIRTYREDTLCMTVDTGKNKICVVGSYNTAFTCGYKMGSKDGFCTPFMATHLVVLKVRRPNRKPLFFRGGDIEAATNELTSCLAMIYHAQEHWHQEHTYQYQGIQYTSHRGKRTGDYGYGVVSDGEWCRFVYLDPHKMVHRSPVLMLKYDILEILQYFRCIFDAIVADYRPPPT